MSNKPDGKDGKKPEMKKAKVYKAKSTKPQKRHEAIVAAHAATGGKKMNVQRGAKRAARRVGLVRGWRDLVARGLSAVVMEPACAQA